VLPHLICLGLGLGLDSGSAYNRGRATSAAAGHPQLAEKDAERAGLYDDLFDADQP
jgi:hypothetical protein